MTAWLKVVLSLVALGLVGGCIPVADSNSTGIEEPNYVPTANIVSVIVSGAEGEYTFSVGIASPDTGCDLYADWWEVVSPDGTLIYRRILTHSHVNEQPFVRSGGPVLVQADEDVIVRAHLAPGGYGGVIFQGNVRDGFTANSAVPNFALDLEQEPPLPDGCAF